MKSALLAALTMLTPSFSSAQVLEPVLAQPVEHASGFSGIWYANQRQPEPYRWKYSGGFAFYPQQMAPLAIHAPEAGKTFFVYGGRGEGANEIHNCVSYLDHATGLVARPVVVLKRATWDAHYNPALSMDAEGYLYLFANSHGQGSEGRPGDDTLGHSFVFKSREPYSIESWVQVRDDNFSYSQPWHARGRGFTWLHTRYAGGNRRLFWATSRDGAAWSEPRQIAAMGQGSYQISWAQGERVATAFDYHPPRGGLNARTNIYYLETRDGRSWQNVRGETVALPLREVSNPALVRDYEKEGLMVFLKDLSFDEAGRPVILFLTTRGFEPGPANGPRQWSTARWTGEEWQVRPITTSDHNYDHGSLFIEGSTWRVVAPTDPGPQPHATGGGICVWASRDAGASWKKESAWPIAGGRNQTYVRRPKDAHDGFWAFWADGNALENSPSSLYFVTRAGQVFRLPEKMEGDFAAPEPVPFEAAR